MTRTLFRDLPIDVKIEKVLKRLVRLDEDRDYLRKQLEVSHDFDSVVDIGVEIGRLDVKEKFMLEALERFRRVEPLGELGGD